MANDGRFVWHELRVTDPDVDARFYTELLGWALRPREMGGTFLAGGVPVGGVSVVNPGVPDHWCPFVACPDVDAAAATARARGGIVTIGEPVDMLDMGRLAPILDPDKSIFAAITPGPAVPAEPATGPGGFAGERLRTPDPSAALAFYAATFGWTPRPETDGSPGTLELPDGTPVARVAQAPPGTPTGWLSVVLVDRLDDVRARAADLGGTASDPIEVPGGGRSAVITDPKGATLAAHERPA